MTITCRTELDRFISLSGPLVHVELSGVRGSSPREAGAYMFVSGADTAGTIGGGRLEYIAMEHARKMLAEGTSQARLSVPLGPRIGQCCGGHVEIGFRALNDADRIAVQARITRELTDQRHVYIFGAGHVGRALARGFALVPLRSCVIDGREEELARVDAAIETRLQALPEQTVGAAPPGSAFIVATHDHGLDFLIAGYALNRFDAAYVGLIGSRSKRASFKKFAADHWPHQDLSSALVCPVGVGRGGGKSDKRPQVIAAFVVAQVLDAFAVYEAKNDDSARRRILPRPHRESV